MNFLPASSLFLGLSSTASVRRPHREAWENVEGTELDDVCGKLRQASSAPNGIADFLSGNETHRATDEPLGNLKAADTPSHRDSESAADSAPSKAASPTATQKQTHRGRPADEDCAHGGCPEACRGTDAVSRFNESNNNTDTGRAPTSPVSSDNLNGDRCVRRDEAAHAFRRTSSGFSTSLPTAPYEQLLFQRQQQRRLMQQQSTLMSIPTISSTSSNADLLAAALEDRYQRQQQPQQQQSREPTEGAKQQHAAATTEASEASVSPGRQAVAAELKGPCLSPSLRLQLLHEVMLNNATTPGSRLGRCEKKWWSMDDRNLEAFIFAHHRTFLRRLGRGVPPAYRWRAWQAVCAYHRELRVQHAGEESASLVYLDPSDETKLREHLASLPDSVDTAAFMEAFEGDVPRTFPELAAVDRDAQGMLFRILNAFANLHVEVGYCQGMNFVAGLLLLVSAFNEFEAFSFFCFVMVHQHVKEFFRERFPLLRKYIRAFDDMAKVYLPELHQHFMDEGVMAPVYLHQWFLTLFITSLPLRSALVVWDFFLAKGLHAVLQLAIALLRVLARLLIGLKFEEIVKFLKSLKCNGDVDGFRIGKMLVKQAAQIQIPKHILKEISPRNLEAIIREAEQEEEAEGRSRNAAFIAAAAAVDKSARANSSGVIAGDDEENSLCKRDAALAAPSNEKSSTQSTPRDQYEEMILLRCSQPAEEAVASGDGTDGSEQGASVGRSWFSRINSDDAGGPSLHNGSPPNHLGQTAPQAGRRKEYISNAESRWVPEEASAAEGTSGGATTPDDGDGARTPDIHQARNNLVETRLDSQEPECDEDGYELLEISDHRRVPGLRPEGGGDRTEGPDTASCTSSAFAEEYEREAVRERESNFIDTITRLWLAGR